MTAVNRIGMDSTPVDVSSAAFWRAATAATADPSPFDGSLISSWRDHHSYDYNPFRFPDNHHHYESATGYYHPDPGMDVYNSSTNNMYPAYMAHHGSSSPPNSENLSSIKPETSVTAFQSAFGLSNPMNFNPHHVQYNSSYGTHAGNSPYEPFYNSTTASYPFPPHSSELKSSRLPADSVCSKQAMFLSTGNYDYKDLSKFCEIFPTPSSSSSSTSSSAVATTSMVNNEKRNPWSMPKATGPLKSNEGRVNRCRICGKIYARPSTLKTHLRTHSGEKPYKCDKCCKAFTQAANLTAHLRTHSGEKPFSCDICGRKFSQSSSVTTHMRTHSGERPYQCKYCRKAFSDSSTLTKHMRVHSGEKPYECSLCRLRFSQSGNLNRHMRIHMNGSANAHLPPSK